MLENLATKGGLIWNVERETGNSLAHFVITTRPGNLLHRHDLTSPDLSASSRYSCRCEEVQTTNLDTTLTWYEHPKNQMLT